MSQYHHNPDADQQQSVKARGQEAPAAPEPTHLSAPQALPHPGTPPAALGPANLLGLQRSMGNQAVQRLLAQPARVPQAPALLQRHLMPMPADLRPPDLTGPKQAWTVDGLLGNEVDDIKRQVMAMIPGDASPSPADRIAALNFISCPPGTFPVGKEYPAKVTEQGGVYFNTEHRDYYNADGSPNKHKIRATVIHESFHAVSANHTGLQNYADLMSATKGVNAANQQQPDEAITELLSIQAYEQIYGQQSIYQTGYLIPASGNFQGAASLPMKQMAGEGRLGIGWTVQMVGIIKEVTNATEDELKAMYFKDPAAFGHLIQGQEAKIKKQWDILLGKSALKEYKLFTTAEPFPSALLEEVIREKQAELSPQSETERVNTVKAALVDKGAAASVKSLPTVLGVHKIKTKLNEILGASGGSATGVPQPQAQAVGGAQQPQPSIPQPQPSSSASVPTANGLPLPQAGTLITADMMRQFILEGDSTKLKKLTDYPWDQAAGSLHSNWIAGIAPQ